LKTEAEAKQNINTQWYKDNHLAIKMKPSEVAQAGEERERAHVQKNIKAKL
jgi:hypothetical protein